MKLKTTVFLVVVSVLFLGGCTYSVKTTTTPPTVPSPTVLATPTPTPSQSLNNLNLDLDSTVDDGGAGDLNQLQKDATGL